MKPRVARIDATLGAVVTDLALAQMDASTWKIVEQAFHEHAVLVFPGQNLTADEQVAFANRFGDIELLAPDPEQKAVAISNQKPDGSVMGAEEHRFKSLRGNEGWHTDSSYMPLAAKASVLSARVIPSTGGQTEWADMRATQVGLAEYLSLPVAKVPVADTRPGLLDSCPQAERAQDADAVGLHGKAGPDGVPRGAALNELGRKTMLVQRRGQGEAGDAATDDQDSFNVGHLSLRRLSQSFSLSFREGW